ncbi:MAG: radical SAM protein [Cyanobacteriota bacterium]
MFISENKNGPLILVSKDIEFTFPFAFAYLAGYLLKEGMQTKIVYYPDNPLKYEKFINEIIDYKPVAIGFGSLYPDLYVVKDLKRILDSKNVKIPTIIGGQMVTPTPEFALEITNADIAVIGEGEIILYELIKALKGSASLENVSGIVFKDNNEYIFTGPGNFIQNLSDLPKVPFDQLPEEKWLNIGRYYTGLGQAHWRYNDRVVYIHGGRGCPFNCNFCYHHSKTRYRKIDEMIVEAIELTEKYKANMVYFGDDLVLCSPQRIRKFVDTIKEAGASFEYSVSCRFDILDKIDDETLQALKDTGCRIMGLGVESGSQRILDIMNKKITVEQIKKGLERLKDVSILPTVSIMVGQHTETPEDVQKSIELMLETVRYNKNIQYAFTITTPFPGTQLYQLALDQGLLKDHKDFFYKFNPQKQMCDLTVNLSDMTDEEVIMFRNKIQDLYEKEKRKLIGKKAYITETIRKYLFKVHKGFNYKLLKKLPKNPLTDLIIRIDNNLHDFCQVRLDSLRLKFLGINPNYAQIKDQE